MADIRDKEFIVTSIGYLCDLPPMPVRLDDAEPRPSSLTMAAPEQHDMASVTISQFDPHDATHLADIATQLLRREALVVDANTRRRDALQPTL